MVDAREATDSERNLASALIGGAFGFIGIAIFASASYADKVDPNSLWWGNIAATISIVLLLASIIFGGNGWVGKYRPGACHPFNFQALFGLIGLVFLVGSAGFFAFNPKQEASAAGNDVLIKRIEDIERKQGHQSEQLETLIKNLSARGAGASTPEKPK